MSSVRIYRASYHHPEDGCVVSWHPSRQAARSHLADMEATFHDVGLEPKQVELMRVPTTKRGLMRWLNIHVQTDNG